jgi:AcrR family transcriptional regulator
MTCGRKTIVKTQSSSPKKSRKKAPRVGPKASAEPRIARRERRRERSREEIVEAARRVLLRDGIAATTLDSIAKEVGLTKAALYYYYSSKDALLFEIMYATFERQARNLHESVEKAKHGRDALRAIVRETITTFGANLDDFRLALLHPQVAGPGTVRVGAEQLARIRPLNELSYAGTAKMLSTEWKNGRGRAGVEPRIMVFLANVAALGVLTMKGLVESFGDPLLYSDEQLIDALSRIFEAAAEP